MAFDLDSQQRRRVNNDLEKNLDGISRNCILADQRKLIEMILCVLCASAVRKKDSSLHGYK
jgi:hypothetical protein